MWGGRQSDNSEQGEAVNEFFDRFTQLIAPPPPSAVRKEWGRVFEEIGTGLPVDYIRLVDIYGGGRLDNYLWVLEPDCPNRSYDLIRAINERAEAFEMLWEAGEPKPSQLEDAENRLIPWASTDNGEFLYWLVQPQVSPDNWNVMVNEARGEEWEYFPLGCMEFLVGALTGSIRSEILSSQFPLSVHEFQLASRF